LRLAEGKLERQLMRRATEPGRFEFGLTAAQEERATRLHRESIVFDMLSMYAGSNIFAAYPRDLWSDFEARVGGAQKPLGALGCGGFVAVR
jgi:hypothetical protein